MKTSKKRQSVKMFLKEFIKQLRALVASRTNDLDLERFVQIESKPNRLNRRNL